MVKATLQTNGKVTTDIIFAVHHLPCAVCCASLFSSTTIEFDYFSLGSFYPILSSTLLLIIRSEICWLIGCPAWMEVYILLITNITSILQVKSPQNPYQVKTPN